VAVVPAVLASIPRGRIVVGVDGSASSELAIAWAAREANLRCARLDLVHAWIPGVGSLDASEQASRALLEEMARGLVDEDPGGPCELLLQSMAGSAVHALMQSAAHAELLVVGARGLSGLRGLLLGSVSRQCAQHAPCPTVVVRGAPARERVMASAGRHAHAS
jgi:nucleotide-binding universal stress UspA family protein